MKIGICFLVNRHNENLSFFSNKEIVSLFPQNEEFEDTKGVIRIRKSKKNRLHNDQKDKQRSTKHTHKPRD